MADREKVIDAFDEAKELVWIDDDEYTVGYNNGLEVGKNLAIAMLEEQQKQIDKLIKESAANAKMAEGLKELLKEQEAEIQQLRLALDIAKGTCKGIKVEGW